MHFNGEALQDIDVEGIVTNIFGKSEHLKRIKSLSNAALGVISSGSLIIHRIGRGMATVLNLVDKHAIKQVDRLLSNEKLNIDSICEHWVPFVVGGRKEIKVTMDWTEFQKDNHSTICLNLVTHHHKLD